MDRLEAGERGHKCANQNGRVTHAVGGGEIGAWVAMINSRCTRKEKRKIFDMEIDGIDDF